MAKTKQVLHLVYFGHEYKVIKHYGVKGNPYRIYQLYCDIGNDGFPHSHKKCVEAYENLASCFYWFLEHRIGF